MASSTVPNGSIDVIEQNEQMACMPQILLLYLNNSRRSEKKINIHFLHKTNVLVAVEMTAFLCFSLNALTTKLICFEMEGVPLLQKGKKCA